MNDNLSSSQRLLLLVKQLREKIEAAEKYKKEAIAIIGMGCRFPGGANDPESFWELLREGVDATEEVPSDRWDVNSYYDANPGIPGKMYVRRGSFLKVKIDEFDAEFFGIAPKEAVYLDPQQRLLLETSWEALENAGIAPNQQAGSRSGVFVGINSSDYMQLQMNGGNVADLGPYFFTGNTASTAAGRLSYHLGWRGPTMAVDTACSSSLVAVNLACQSLRSRESDLAIAGGVNLILSPLGNIVLSQMRALSPEGRCKTFDASADGYGRGEGCGVVVLKRLSDAMANGDNILATICGSAVNHDGRSGGLTVPNGLAQQEVIRAALENAKIEPHQVSYVEVHGTGTSLGDPIEVEALGMVLNEDPVADLPLTIASVKTNIGHLEAAAGMASLIKTVLALQHGEIPPHLHFSKPNPFIPWDKLSVRVPTELIPWESDRPRFAGVSSFGMSGTNAHVVLGEPPKLEVKKNDRQERSLHILALSAKSEVALLELASRYRRYLETHPEVELADICFTANTGRAHFAHRLAVVGSSHNEMAAQLGEWEMESPPAPRGSGGGERGSGNGLQLAPLSDLATAYMQGVDIDWMELDRGFQRQRVHLPTYPFQRQRYWIDLPETEHLKQTKGDKYSNWFYRVEWEEKELAKSGSTSRSTPGTWLILADRSSGIGRRRSLADATSLSTLLEKRGETVIVAFPDGNIPELFEQIQDLPPCRGIVHLWSLETTPTSETTIGTLEEDQLRNCGSVLQLVQALTNSSGVKSSLPKLWLVTRDAQPLCTTGILPVDAPSLAVAQTPVLGLGRTVAIEHPELWGGTIDVTATDDGEAIASMLLAEIWHPDGELEIAIRQGKRYVPRLVGCQNSSPTSKLDLHPDCTYLLTGGLGALGLTFAKWMVERGGRHLVLVGRNSPSEEARERVRELEKMGAQIIVASGDVSREGDVQKILADIDRNLPPLRGVIHLAGVLDDGILQKQSWERFARVMKPKVQGAWNLHVQTLGLPLDFFVCFSSIASVLGSPGQGNYAAANAYLDGIARYRRSLSLPALTVNWSPWGETGMAAALGDRGEDRWAAIGVKTLSPLEGQEVWEGLLETELEEVQKTILPVNWPLFFQQFPAGMEPPLLAKIAAKERTPLTQEKPKIYLQLEEVLAKERKALLIAAIQEEVAVALGNMSHKPKPQLGFFEMGMDSLMALELRNRLQNSIGKPLPSTLTFEYPNIEAIADYLLQEVLCLESSVDEPQNVAFSLRREKTSDEETVLDRKKLWEEEAKQLSEAELSELIDRELEALIKN